MATTPNFMYDKSPNCLHLWFLKSLGAKEQLLIPIVKSYFMNSITSISVLVEYYDCGLEYSIDVKSNRNNIEL